MYVYLFQSPTGNDIGVTIFLLLVGNLRYGTVTRDGRFSDNYPLSSIFFIITDR